jgi:hypothetical protein
MSILLRRSKLCGGARGQQRAQPRPRRRSITGLGDSASPIRQQIRGLADVRQATRPYGRVHGSVDASDHRPRASRAMAMRRREVDSPRSWASPRCARSAQARRVLVAQSHARELRRRPARILDGHGHPRGSSPAAGRDLARALYAELARRVRDTGVPGASSALVVHGRLMWSGGAGMADLRARRPMTASTPCTSPASARR